MRILNLALIGLILVTSLNCKKSDDNENSSSNGTVELLIGNWLLDGLEFQGVPETLELCDYLTSLTFREDLTYRYKVYGGDSDCEANQIFNYNGQFSVKAGVIYDEILEMQGTNNAFAFEIVSINESELVLALGITEQVYTYVKQ